MAGRRTSQTLPPRSIQQATPWRCGRALRRLSRESSGLAAREGGAVGTERAVAAARRPGRQIGGAEVHHRLDEIARPLPRHQSHTRSLDLARDGFQPAEPGDHPLDIGIDGRRLFAERDRGDRARGVIADAGQRPQRRGGSRECAAGGDPAGAGDQVAGPRVIAEPGPFREHVLVARGGNASMVGQRATKRSNRGVTAATVVCWSMISLSHTR